MQLSKGLVRKPRSTMSLMKLIRRLDCNQAGMKNSALLELKYLWMGVFLAKRPIILILIHREKWELV